MHDDLILLVEPVIIILSEAHSSFGSTEIQMGVSGAKGVGTAIQI